MSHTSLCDVCDARPVLTSFRPKQSDVNGVRSSEDPETGSLKCSVNLTFLAFFSPNLYT